MDSRDKILSCWDQVQDTYVAFAVQGFKPLLVFPAWHDFLTILFKILRVDHATLEVVPYRKWTYLAVSDVPQLSPQRPAGQMFRDALFCMITGKENTNVWSGNLPYDFRGQLVVLNCTEQTQQRLRDIAKGPWEKVQYYSRDSRSTKRTYQTMSEGYPAPDLDEMDVGEDMVEERETKLRRLNNF